MFFVQPRADSGTPPSSDGYLVVADADDEPPADAAADDTRSTRTSRSTRTARQPPEAEEDAHSSRDRQSVRKQSAAFWDFLLQELLGMALTAILLAVLWYTFSFCKICVLVVFILSSLLCMRLPYLQIVFWPSLFILLLNLHLLRGVHVKVDIPVGETIDGFLAPSG